jgi:hypothetical protein
VDAGPAGAGLAALLGVGVAVLEAAGALGASDAVAATLAGAVGVLAYAVALRVLFPALWRDLVRIAARIALPARPRRLAGRRKPESAPAVS